MDKQSDGQDFCFTRPGGNDPIVSRLAQQDKVPWYRKPNLRLLYLAMVPACIAVEITSGFDASMMNGLQAVPSWLEYYHYPRSALLGVMGAMYSLGSVAAVPFVPFVVDTFGRRYPILLGGAISIVGAIIQGSALNFAMFIIARFILGFANVLCLVAATSLIGEISHPKERAIMVSLLNNSYELGAVFAAGVTLGTFSMASNFGWRIPSYLQGVPSLLQASCILFIPESPRWLISKGRSKEAYEIIVKYHGEGDYDSDFVKAEYTQIEQTLEAELKNSRMNWKEMFSRRGTRKRVVIASFLALFTQWCGTGLVSRYLSQILDTIGIHNNRTKNIINVAATSSIFITGLFTALIVPRYPRRMMFLAGTISLLVVFTAWTAASAEYSVNGGKVASQAALVLIFFFGVAYNLAFTPLTYTFLVELFPFHTRARGITVFQWWSRIGAFFNQFVNPIGINSLGWKWYLFYCAWDALQVVLVYFMFPETSGRTLEELTFLFEDDREEFRCLQKNTEDVCSK